MASSSSGWDRDWYRCGQQGMEAALSAARCSQQTIVGTRRKVTTGAFNLEELNSLTDPPWARGVVLATLGRDISPIERVFSGKNVRPMTVDEAVALCVNLDSNTNIKHLELDYLKVFGTVEVCKALGSALSTNSSVQDLHMRLVYMDSEAVRCLLHGLESNRTLKRLNLDTDSPLLDEGICHVAEFLKNNSTLETLSLGIEAVGAASVKRLLQPLEETRNSSSQKNTSLRKLELCGANQECVEFVAHLIRTNKSLHSLGLSSRGFRPTDWTESIFPALNENDTLKVLDLHGCDGLIENEAYEYLMDVLHNSETRLEQIMVSGTTLESRQEQIDEKLRECTTYRSRLKDQHQTPTASGCIVLCGNEDAGKTEISKTMKHVDHGAAFTHVVKTTFKKQPLIAIGRDVYKELAVRSRGFEVVALKKQQYVKFIWDFAGQKEQYAFMFPDAKNSLFLYVCSCRHPPDDPNLKGKEKDRSFIKDEFEYWLRLLASTNIHSRGGGSHGSQVPQVMFILTKTGTLRSPKQVINEASAVVRELKEMFKDVLNLCEDVKVVNAQSYKDVQLLLRATNNNLKDILAHQKRYEVCEQVGHFLKGWAKQNPKKPVLSVEELTKLWKDESKCYQRLEGEEKIVLAYLNDSREIIFLEKLDLIVTNPNWLGIVLGSLIDAFKVADHRQTGFLKWTAAVRCRVEVGPHHVHGFVKTQAMKEYLECSLSDVKQAIPTEKLIDLMIHLDMCFQNETDSSLFVPALFDDENKTAAKGKPQLRWKVGQTGHLVYVGRRLKCQNRSTTLLTPGFFSRLQVYLWNYIHAHKWTENVGLEVGRNLIFFTESGVEVCVEYAGDNDDFIDILVRSSKPYTEAVEFIEKHVVETIRTFCASPQGCQGLDLLESVIRPVCVRELHSCIKRKAHSFSVSELKGKLAKDKRYVHTWKEKLEGASDTDSALYLLNGEEGSHQRIGQEENSTVSESSSTHQQPTLFYPILDIAILPRISGYHIGTGLHLHKKIPVKLRLLCHHNHGSHTVRDQPGRTVMLDDNARNGYDVPILKLGVTLLWAGVGVGATMVGASAAVPMVDNWIKSLFDCKRWPALDGNSLYRMMNPGHPPGPVSSEEILKALESYLKVDPHTQGLKEILKLDDGTSFWNDFRLRKVVYTAYENKIRWVCEEHFQEGFQQKILVSAVH